MTGFSSSFSDFYGIGATNHRRQEIQCLLSAGIFLGTTVLLSLLSLMSLLLLLFLLSLNMSLLSQLTQLTQLSLLSLLSLLLL